MEYTFAVEIRTGVQDARGLTLLQYYGAPVVVDPTPTRAICRIGSENRVIACRDRVELVSELRGQEFNQIEFTYDASQLSGCGRGCTVLGAGSFFDVPPTSRIWKHAVGGDSASMTFRSREIRAEVGKISNWPFLLEFVAFLETAEIGETAMAALVEGFCRDFRQIPFDIPIIGSMDLYAQGARRVGASSLSRFAASPRACQQLDRLFDGLHRVLFGPISLCEYLAGTLRGAASLHPADGESQIGLVVIDERTVCDPAAVDAVRDAIVQP